MLDHLTVVTFLIVVSHVLFVRPMTPPRAYSTYDYISIPEAEIAVRHLAVSSGVLHILSVGISRLSVILNSPVPFGGDFVCRSRFRLDVMKHRRFLPFH